MKQILIGLFFLSFIHTGICQEVKTYEFVGTLQLSDNTIITYKLSFSELSDGKIEGSSITDIYGPNRTQSKIEGTYNSKTKNLSFRETENVSTKSRSAANDFCFVNVTNANAKMAKEKSVIQGKFTGRTPNGTLCAQGNIYLIGATNLAELSNQILNSNTIKNSDSLAMLKEKANALINRSTTNNLKSNESLTLNWESNEAIIEVWDGGGQEDKDEIGIFLNDKNLYPKFEIKQQKQLIRIPLDGNINTIKILAISEGLWKPCTANIILKDGEKEIPIIASLRKGQTTSIEIKKAKPQ